MGQSIDVLIPCFNTARYVGAAIDSVLSQSCPVARVILLDDGSTDASATVIREYGRPVEYHRQDNGGISSARNAAARLASADFIAFLDADDLWTEDSLQRRMEHLKRSPQLDGVFGAFTAFVSPELGQSAAGRFRFSPRPSLARFAGTLLIKRNSFNQVGFFDENIRVGEMIEWLARAEALGLRFGTVSDSVLRRRIHDSNTVLKCGDAREEYLRAVKSAMSTARAGGSKPQ